MRGRENKFLFLFVVPLDIQVEKKAAEAKLFVLCVEGEMKKIIYMH